MTEPTATTTTATTAAPTSTSSSTAPGSSTSAQTSAPAVNERSQGHSPAMQQRQAQQAPAGEQMIRVGDQDFTENDIRAALGARAEAELRKSSLPASPDGYELKLPDNFRAPEGIQWEWNTKDPMLQQARAEAHRLGLDQSAFSSLLGLYAADKMNTEVQLAWARQAELQKLGPAADSRLANVTTWLRSQLGSDADSFANQMNAYPQEKMLRAFERLMSKFISQGSAPFDQRGRVNENNRGKIPNYDSLDFKGRRIAQMQATMYDRNPTEGR